MYKQTFLRGRKLSVMAALKLLILLIALICTTISAGSDIQQEIAASDSALELELEQLKSKISGLELSIDDKVRELKTKDETVLWSEKIIDEKSDSIQSLQAEIDSLQKRGSVETNEQVGKAHARASELEKQVEKLKKEIEAQKVKKDALEARTTEAETKIQKLDLQLQNLQKINDEQKHRIRKTERALQVSEEEMVKFKLEATSKSKELIEVHGAWLPRWFETHLVSFQSFIATHWNQHGKPALNIATQKGLQTIGQAQKWAELHMETTKSIWILAVKEHWISFTAFVEPHVQSLTAKTVEVYESSKSTITPHVVRAHKLADPYFQEAKKFTKPYIDHVVAVTKPHVDKAQVALKPHTKKAVRVYKKFLKSATYHNQVQATVKETLNKHELTRPLATKELVWFLASALLALPVVFLPRFFSAMFCKKTKKPVRNTHTNHTRRRHKRVHVDK